MTFWYALCDVLPLPMLQWDFMKNALLAVIIMAPLFGLTSTMIVTGKMSFFSDALGHSAFTGIAIGAIFGVAAPTWVAVIFSIAFAILFSVVRSHSNQTADTLIGVFSSTAVALGIFIATMNGGSFTKYNRYLIGDILSISATEIALLLFVLIGITTLWFFLSNKLILASVHPQLAASRGISVAVAQTLFTVAISVVVTLSISWIGLLILNSLLVLPGAASRNISKNLKQYHLFSVLIALIAGITGLCISYQLGVSAGSAISLVAALLFFISFIFRRGRR